MTTSARNTLNGTIAAITPGAVHTEIALQFKTQQIIAVITNASAERLEVEPGDEAYILGMK
jgi:molybdate transport system regulatory protein